MKLEFKGRKKENEITIWNVSYGDAFETDDGEVYFKVHSPKGEERAEMTHCLKISNAYISTMKTNTPVKWYMGVRVIIDREKMA